MTTRMKVHAMDGLQQIQQTLSEIDRRIPNALRAAFHIGYRVVEGDDIDGFVAAVLPPPISELDCHHHHRTELDELPFAREDVPEDDASTRRALRMDCASCYVPKPVSDHDAHFGVADLGVIGVADGVGSYRELGVDPGAFSRSLMEIARRKKPLPPGEPICPYMLLEHAYDETVKSNTPGASTAVVISLVGDKLRWANLGDSGFAVLRGGTVVHRSRPQYRRDGCPFQLAAKGGWSVAEAEVGETAVREGDVVVVGTDGLFDNVFDAELERVVRMGAALAFSPKNMADVIAGVAFEVSLSGSKDLPHSVAQRQRHGGARRGGKPDDITVVVAFITSTADQLAGVDKTEDDGVTSNWVDEVKRKKKAREQIRLVRDAASPVPVVRARIGAPAACRARALDRSRPAPRSASADRARRSAARRY